MTFDRIGMVVHAGRPEAVAAARQIEEWAARHAIPVSDVDVWRPASGHRRSARDEVEAAEHPSLIVTIGGDAPVLRANATSPRTVFDGQRFWISYIDERGDVVAGFLDGNRKPVTMALNGVHPSREGYELAIVNGAPTIFALDDTGYSAYGLCAVTE